jgi:hypothetical protein
MKAHSFAVGAPTRVSALPCVAYHIPVGMFQLMWRALSARP